MSIGRSHSPTPRWRTHARPRCAPWDPSWTLSPTTPRSPSPTAVYAKSGLLGDLAEAGVEALRDTAGPGSGSELLFVEPRQFGGALSVPSARGGALEHMDGSFLVLGVGLDEPGRWEAVRENSGRVTDALKPWATESAADPHCPFVPHHRPPTGLRPTPPSDLHAERT